MDRQNELFARSRAAAICDRLGIDDSNEYQRMVEKVAHQSFREEIQPFIAIKMQPYSLKIPKIVVYHDGNVESSYEFSEQEMELFRLCDEAIAISAKSWGFEPLK